MRITVEIDDELLAAAMAATGLRTKRAAVEEGLRTLIRLRSQIEAFENLGGLGWEGNLNEMREGRHLAGQERRR
jgi:Arc/MetJ family transcription regulator